MTWWLVSARKWFKGPKVNVQHLMLGRESNVIEGANEKGDAIQGDGSSGDEQVEGKMHIDDKNIVG
jgi:hypothetical protein